MQTQKFTDPDELVFLPELSAEARAAAVKVLAGMSPPLNGNEKESGPYLASLLRAGGSVTRWELQLMLGKISLRWLHDRNAELTEVMTKLSTVEGLLDTAPREHGTTIERAVAEASA